MDLLNLSFLKRFARRRTAQFILQTPFVLLFFIIITAGLFGSQFPDRNIATIATWTVWWGGVIFTFLFFWKALVLRLSLGRRG